MSTPARGGSGYVLPMAPLFWTGKLGAQMRFLTNANSMLAWVTGTAPDTEAMHRAAHARHPTSADSYRRSA